MSTAASHPIPSPPSHSPRLVDDLIPVILDSDDHWWPRDYMRMALIASSWLFPVRKRLYAKPSLSSYPACVAFARAITENPELAGLVRGVEIRPVADARSSLKEEDMASLRTILALTGLGSVALSGDLSIQSERLLNAMRDTRSVTALRVDGPHSGAQVSTTPWLWKGPSLEWDDQIAFSFPNLRSLELSNLTLLTFPATFPRPGRLTHLTLERVDTLDTFVHDLCLGSWDELRVLKVVTTLPERTDDNVRLMLEHCRNLEVLQYETGFKHMHTSLFDRDPPNHTNLRKLHLANYDINSQTLGTIARSFDGLAELVVLGRSVRIAPAEWAAFVATSAPPKLKRLSIPAGTNEPPFAHWSSGDWHLVQEACAARDIQILGEMNAGG